MAPHGDKGLGRSKDALIAGEGEASTGRKLRGDGGMLVVRSSKVGCVAFRPSKCDLKEETGLIGAASGPWLEF